MSKFTKGPWGTEIAEYGSKRIGTIFGKGGDIARVVGKPAGKMYLPPGAGITQYRLNAETDANARLIAAAPELYEALQSLLEAFLSNNVTLSHCNAARAALAKVDE
jgi:hypothetical protein